MLSKDFPNRSKMAAKLLEVFFFTDVCIGTKDTNYGFL